MKYVLVTSFLGLAHSIPFQHPREAHHIIDVRGPDPDPQRPNIVLSIPPLTQRTPSPTDSPPSDVPVPEAYRSDVDGFETSGISPWSDNGRSEMLHYQVEWMYCPRRWVNCRKCPKDLRCLSKSGKVWDWSWGLGGGNEGTPGNDDYDTGVSGEGEHGVHDPDSEKVEDSGDKYADWKTFDTHVTIEGGHGAVQVPGDKVDGAEADYVAGHLCKS